MPNGDEYRYTDISLADFESALTVILQQLEDAERNQTPLWKRAAWMMAPSPIFGKGAENIGEKYDRIYSEIMSAVTTYGLSPDVARALSSQAGPIFTAVLQNRATYKWRGQYQKNLEQYEKDVAKAFEESFAQKRWESEFGLAERKFQWEQQEAKKEWRYQALQDIWERWGLEQQLQREQQARRATVASARMLAQQAGQWEAPEPNRAKIWNKIRSEILSQLTEPRDWIKRWELKNLQNPYLEQTPETATGERRWAEAELDKAKSWVKTAEDLLKTAKDPETQLTPQEMEYVYAAHQARDIALRKVAEAQQKEEDWIKQHEAYTGYGAGGTGMQTATGVAYGGGEPPRIPQPTTPETPSWLKAMYPTLGERLPEKEAGFPTMTPTMQQWRALTPSQREGWAGTLEWYEQEPKVVLERMYSMLPKQPRVPTRWSPARQWA